MSANNLHVPRERDETILRLLAWRSAGHKSADIGKRFGITRNNVNATTNTIKSADIHESGEPRDQVMAEYWA